MLDLKYAELLERSAGRGAYRLCCVVCGAEDDDLLRLRCAACGGAMDAIHDLSAARIGDGYDPLARYASLLPVHDPAHLRWLGEGNTGCLHAEGLGRWLGMDAVFLKDEAANPTRSTKDRMTSVALARFAELGVRRLVVASTGNSSTAYARAARMLGGFEVHVFVGAAFVERLNYPDWPGVHTYLVESDFVSAGNAGKVFAEDTGAYWEGGFFNPSRREGLKLAYLEAFDQMPVAPRYVFQAVSSGMGLLGAYKGALEYRALGRLAALPGFVGVQQDTCSPMASAFAEGSPEIQPRHVVRDPAGIAKAILRGDPTQAYPYVNALCRSTGGRVLSVDTAEIRRIRRLLSELEGVDVCYSSATAVAGLVAMRRSGELPADAPVLVNLTGADRPRSPTPRTVLTYDAASRTVRPPVPTEGPAPSEALRKPEFAG